MNEQDWITNYEALAADFISFSSKHKNMTKRIAEIVGADPDEDLSGEVERYAKRLRAINVSHVAAAVAAEREACAKVADEHEESAHEMLNYRAEDEAQRIAAAIRARGGK